MKRGFTETKSCGLVLIVCWFGWLNSIAASKRLATNVATVTLSTTAQFPVTRYLKIVLVRRRTSRHKINMLRRQQCLLDRVCNIWPLSAQRSQYTCSSFSATVSVLERYYGFAFLVPINTFYRSIGARRKSFIAYQAQAMFFDLWFPFVLRCRIVLLQRLFFCLCSAVIVSLPHSSEHPILCFGNILLLTHAVTPNSTLEPSLLCFQNDTDQNVMPIEQVGERGENEDASGILFLALGTQ